MRILLIEDDPSTSAFVKKGLGEIGHVCDDVADGSDGLFQALHETYDLAIVDRKLPGIDGLSLVRALRAAGSRMPVIFLTAIGGVEDRVEGLRAGADDYLTKPFAFSELLARIEAVGRRPGAEHQQTILRVADLELDLLRRTCHRAGREIRLLPKEFLLLEVLMRADGRVVTRTMLLEQVWDFNFEPQTSVVETHVSRLRAKIDKPFDTALIHTVKSFGYAIHSAG